MRATPPAPSLNCRSSVDLLGFRPFLTPASRSIAEAGGRPSKFTENRIDEILAVAKQGVSKKGCARVAGISESTLSNWLRQQEERPASEFVEDEGVLTRNVNEFERVENLDVKTY